MNWYWYLIGFVVIVIVISVIYGKKFIKHIRRIIEETENDPIDK